MNAMEFVAQSFGAATHFRTNTVQAEGGAAFTAAALVRNLYPIAAEVPLFGNSTDLAATNGWYISLTPTGTAPAQVDVNFVVRETVATQTATVTLPAGFLWSGKPFTIIGGWSDDGLMDLFVNGVLMAEIDTTGLTAAIGQGRLCFGSMPAAAGNTAQANIMCCGYLPQAVNGPSGQTLARTLSDSMLQTGEILVQPDASQGLAWTHLYSVQRSALRTKTTYSIINGAYVPTAPLVTDVTIANLGTAGTAGDLVPFGTVRGFSQVAPIGFSAL